MRRKLDCPKPADLRKIALKNAENATIVSSPADVKKRKPWYSTLVSVLKVLAIIIIIPPFLNYAALQREIAELTGDGELHDIGSGQKLFMQCSGKGAPTVILDAPTGVSSDAWELVVNHVSKVTKVCVYDRAGIGFSERPYMKANFSDGDTVSETQPDWLPSTAERMTNDLHELLSVSSQTQPYILVGSELGALIAQFYTQLYAGDVAGLVLISPLSEDIFQHDGGVWSHFWFNHLIPSFQAFQLGAAVGLTRIALLLGLVSHPLHQADLSDLAHKRQKHLLCHPRHLSSVVDEHVFINETFSQIKLVRILKSAPDEIPVTVLTGNYYDENLPSYLNKAWAKSEENLISRHYPNAPHIVINGGDHHMLYRKPNIVAEHVNKMVRQYRQRHKQK